MYAIVSETESSKEQPNLKVEIATDGANYDYVSHVQVVEVKPSQSGSNKGEANKEGKPIPLPPEKFASGAEYSVPDKTKKQKNLNTKVESTLDGEEYNKGLHAKPSAKHLSMLPHDQPSSEYSQINKQATKRHSSGVTLEQDSSHQRACSPPEEPPPLPPPFVDEEDLGTCTTDMMKQNTLDIHKEEQITQDAGVGVAYGNTWVDGRSQTIDSTLGGSLGVYDEPESLKLAGLQPPQELYMNVSSSKR